MQSSVTNYCNILKRQTEHVCVSTGAQLFVEVMYTLKAHIVQHPLPSRDAYHGGRALHTDLERLGGEINSSDGGG